MDNNLTNITNENLNTFNSGKFCEKKFIGDLYVCESTKHILEERIDEINYQLDDLGTDKKELCIPIFEKSSFRDEYNKEGQLSQKYPKKPIKPYEYKIKIDIEETLVHLCFSTFIAVIIYLILGFFIIGFFYDEHSIFFYLISLTPFIIGAIIYTYWICFSDKVKKRSDYKNNIIKYREELQRYEIECEIIDKNNTIIKKKNTELWNQKKKKYNEWVEKEKANYLEYSQKYDSEINAKRYIYNQELNVAESKLSEVTIILKRLYSMRINDYLCIHPNYQGLVPVTIIYGYFDTGRCSSLRGFEGAYNLYEDERIKGMIINKLDDIIEQLEHLNATMDYVARCIINCERQLEFLNRNMERLIEETTRANNNFMDTMYDINNKMTKHHQDMDDYAKQIESNTANSAYYSEVGAKINALNMFYGLYKDL